MANLKHVGYKLFIVLTLAGPIVFSFAEKNEPVGSYETQRLIPKFKVSGQLVTSQVRSMTQISGFGF